MFFAILDDNPIFLESIKRAVSEYHNKLEITYFTEPEEFLNYISNNVHKINGVFLDIVLDNINGMEIARKVHETAPDINIVFVTGYVKEYCQNIFLSDFDITPFAFLTKPLDKNVLYKIFDKFTEKENTQSLEDIMIKTAEGYVFINPLEICYLESQKRMVKFSLTDKTELHTYGKIADFSGQLKYFQYSHKSFFVNLRCVKKFNTNEVIMINEDKIPISQRYQKQFKEELLFNRGRK